MTTLLVVSTFGPLILIILTETLRERSFGKVRARVVWNWYKEFLVVYGMVLLLTEAAKVAFGEHRPHFLHTCAPDVGKNCETGMFMEEYKCTNEATSKYFLTDSSRSFPSGHASVSFVAGTYGAVSARRIAVLDESITKIFSDRRALANAYTSNRPILEASTGVSLPSLERPLFLV